MKELEEVGGGVRLSPVEHGAATEGERDLNDGFAWERDTVGDVFYRRSKTGDKVVNGCIGVRILIAGTAHRSWVEGEEFGDKREVISLVSEAMDEAKGGEVDLVKEGKGPLLVGRCGGGG